MLLRFKALKLAIDKLYKYNELLEYLKQTAID
jgi:hypothetical protein